VQWKAAVCQYGKHSRYWVVLSFEKRHLAVW